MKQGTFCLSGYVGVGIFAGCPAQRYPLCCFPSEQLVLLTRNNFCPSIDELQNSPFQTFPSSWVRRGRGEGVSPAVLEQSFLSLSFVN